MSSVSHDLRTPLATDAGAASSIVESSGDFGVDSCKALAREIYDQAARLNRLVTNLLDMTRLQSGQLKLNQNWLPADGSSVVLSVLLNLSCLGELSKSS